MSYRDKVEDIYEGFKDEYLYGYDNNTPVIFSVETASAEDNVTFKEEGGEELERALDIMLLQVDENLSGGAIHDIKSWYDLVK